MKPMRKILGYCILIALGITLLVLGGMGIVEEYWSGMGSAFLFISALQILRLVRLQKNRDYREKLETEISDERNRFLRTKAWAWAGYLFILIAAVASIVLRIAGQELLSTVSGCAVLLITLLYWISFWFLRKKY